MCLTDLRIISLKTTTKLNSTTKLNKGLLKINLWETGMRNENLFYTKIDLLDLYGLFKSTRRVACLMIILGIIIFIIIDRRK